MVEERVAGRTVSYSQFSIYAKCPKKWKLDYVEGQRVYEDSINTIFGTSFHSTLQHYLKVMYEDSVKAADAIDLVAHLQAEMVATYKASIEKTGQHFTTPEVLQEFLEDGIAILKYVQRHRGVFFPSKQHELLGIEIPLKVELTKHISFNGFIDLVILDQRTNRIKIWDIKTSTSGWNKHQKKDQTKTAQLILYKEYYAKQFTVDPESIDVEYFIVRRKINENAEFVPKRVQTFSPASGKVTRKRVIKQLSDFLEHGFTEDGEYNREGSFPAIQSSLCVYCAYNKPGVCDKKERLKKV